MRDFRSQAKKTQDRLDLRQLHTYIAHFEYMSGHVAQR